ncbi:MAG TPA: VWA domain-containing protein [Candidatus Marinimicrobia bacterium]|nr:VWA domain-containing protein [Candidatus Neomarinimicrobiota bacterium]
MGRMLIIFLLLVSAQAASVPNNDEFAQVADEQSLWLILDRSLSMRNNDSEGIRFKAIEAFLQALPDAMRFGVQLFNGETEAIIPFTPLDSLTKIELAKKIYDQASQLGYYTDIKKALDEALKLLLKDRPDQPLHACHVILITDGHQEIRGGQRAVRQSLTELEEEIIPYYRKLKIPIYTVGLSLSSDTLLLQNMSKHTGGFYALALQAENLDEGLDSILIHIKNNSVAFSLQNKFLYAAKLYSQSPDSARSFLIENFAIKTGSPAFYLYLLTILFGLSFLANLTIMRFAFNPKESPTDSAIPFYLREKMDDSQSKPQNKQNIQKEAGQEDQEITPDNIMDTKTASPIQLETESNTERIVEAENEPIDAESTENGILFTIKEEETPGENTEIDTEMTRPEKDEMDHSAEKSASEPESTIPVYINEIKMETPTGKETKESSELTKGQIEKQNADIAKEIPKSSERVQVKETVKEAATKELAKAKITQALPTEILSIHCKFHSKIPAVTKCSDCSIPLCETCIVSLDNKSLCAECAQKREIKRMLGI